MDEAERLMFEGWAKMPQFKRKVEQAREFIKEAFAISKKPYLSCSGGKDSIAMLVLVDEVAKEIDRDYLIWSHVSDASFPGTKETIEKATQICSRQLIFSQSQVSAFEVLKTRDKISLFGKSGYFFDSIRKFEEEHEIDLAFVGVRASESKRRKEAARVHGHLFRSTVTTDRWVCNPLVWFGIEDVFALILLNGFPLHPIYSKRHPEGIKAIRLGYLTSQDLLNKGTLSFIRDNYPEQYQQIITAKPSLSVNT